MKVNKEKLTEYLEELKLAIKSLERATQEDAGKSLAELMKLIQKYEKYLK